jgi:uncharacterized protein YegP (UPF0339 family)
MGAFVISKRFNGEYKFVFTSRKGKVIFTSPGYALKAHCELGIEHLKDNVVTSTYIRIKASNGKFFFKLLQNDVVLAMSRKYSTELRLQKGIDEIIRDAKQAEVLDFSENDNIFG